MTSHAILLTAYGSRHPGAGPAFERMESLVRARHPDVPLAWAYTSKNVRKLVHADSPAEALDKLAQSGVRRVCAQSLHLIPGAEYEELVQAAADKKSRFDKLVVGRPLLASQADIEAVATALRHVAKPYLEEREAVVFVGHGADHPGNQAFLDLENALIGLDSRLVLGLLEAGAGIEGVLHTLAARKVHTIALLPLFFSAGHHAAIDLDGPGPDSWRSRLVAAGYDVLVRLCGAVEHDRLAELWLTHLRDAVRELQKS